MYGGDGKDELFGSTGGDLLVGGDEDDLFFYSVNLPGNFKVSGDVIEKFESGDVIQFVCSQGSLEDGLGDQWILHYMLNGLLINEPFTIKGVTGGLTENVDFVFSEPF